MEGSFFLRGGARRSENVPSDADALFCPTDAGEHRTVGKKGKEEKNNNKKCKKKGLQNKAIMPPPTRQRENEA